MFEKPIKDPILRQQAERILVQLRELQETWRYLRSTAEREKNSEQVASCNVQIDRIDGQCDLLELALRDNAGDGQAK